MNSADPGNNYQITYNSSTFKVTFSSSNTLQLLFSSSNTCFKELGFLNASTIVSTNLIGPNAIQLYFPISAFIIIKEFGTNNFTSSGSQYTFKIPLTTLSSGVVEFDINSFYKQQINFDGLQNYNRLSIALIDNEGHQLNLNRGDFEMLIKFN
jgi:hypothetical protein